jgi:hypothetical protein
MYASVPGVPAVLALALLRAQCHAPVVRIAATLSAITSLARRLEPYATGSKPLLMSPLEFMSGRLRECHGCSSFCGLTSHLLMAALRL